MNILDLNIDEYDRTPAICKECGLVCNPEWLDLSFEYEYNGSRGTNKQGVWVSDCCNSEIE